MTLLELRALLRRVNPRLLREDADIRGVTVAKALGVPLWQVYDWETGRSEPHTTDGFRWARFICGLERHAEVTAEMWRNVAA